MKRVLMFLLLAMTIIAGCTKVQTAPEPQSVPKQTVAVKKEIKAEVTDETFYRWINPATGKVEAVSVYAAIKNTNTGPISVSQTRITFLDRTREAIMTISGQHLMPSTLSPGQTAYLAFEQEAGLEMSDVTSIMIDVTPIATQTASTKLTYENVKIHKAGKSLAVTGELANSSNETVSRVEAAAGLYSKDGRFLAALVLSSEQQLHIAANGKTNIALETPSTRTDIIKLADYAIISAASLEE